MSDRQDSRMWRNEDGSSPSTSREWLFISAPIDADSILATEDGQGPNNATVQGAQQDRQGAPVADNQQARAIAVAILNDILNAVIGITPAEASALSQNENTTDDQVEATKPVKATTPTEQPEDNTVDEVEGATIEAVGQDELSDQGSSDTSDSMETVIHVLPSNSCSDWQSTDEGSWPSLDSNSGTSIQKSSLKRVSKVTNIQMANAGVDSSTSSSNLSDYIPSAFNISLLSSSGSSIDCVGANDTDSEESHCTVDEISSSELDEHSDLTSLDDNTDDWPVLPLTDSETKDVNDNRHQFRYGPISVGDKEIKALMEKTRASRFYISVTKDPTRTLLASLPKLAEDDQEWEEIQLELPKDPPKPVLKHSKNRKNPKLKINPSSGVAVRVYTAADIKHVTFENEAAVSGQSGGDATRSPSPANNTQRRRRSIVGWMWRQFKKLFCCCSCCPIEQ